MRFEWDDEKAARNERKHRVSFESAQEVFDDPRAVPFEDLEHSSPDETRYLMIGMTSSVLLLVSFIYRDDTIRLISALVAEKRFLKIYEDEN